MDYSLLVGIHSHDESCSHEVDKPINNTLDRISTCVATDEEGNTLNEIYFLGIIDILTEYTTPKKIEHFFKSIRYFGSEFSTVEPDQYADRLIRFIFHHVLPQGSLLDYDTHELPQMPL